MLTPLESDTINIPILEVRKLRQREIKYHAQDYTPNLGFGPRQAGSRICALYSYARCKINNIIHESCENIYKIVYGSIPNAFVTLPINWAVFKFTV